VARALQTAHIPTLEEPQNLTRSDGRRPDGVTLILFEQGKSLVYDVTTRCSLAQTYLDASARNRRYVANKADSDKLAKYADLRARYLVQAVAFETMA